MYGPLWRLLPGPWQVKAFLSLILVGVVVAVCFLWLFPAIAPFMPFNDNSVQFGLHSPRLNSPRLTTSAP
jgi:hypothetical protein